LNQKRKICVITGTRSEYGLLFWLMKEIQSSNTSELQIIVTGTHLSPEFGETYREIEKDGFFINKKVEILLASDSPVGISKSMGLAMIGFSDAYANLNPDIIVVLGDRFEIFSAVSAATVARIPIAHLSGGETTEGAFDEAFRHSITKMSHLHFVSTKKYKERVIQLGEQRDEFLDETNSQNVMARPIWKLMSELSIFQDAECGDLTNSEWLEQRVVNIPSSVII